MSITKAELETAVKRLAAENAALRDLLAAVQETASTGEQAHGEGAEYYYAGHFAAMRISIWLEDVPDQDTKRLAATAAMFREHVGGIAARVAAPAKDDAPSVASDEAAAVLGASIAPGQPVITDDEDEDDRPTALLGCGDQLGTDEVVLGDPVTCPRHGETTVTGFIGDDADPEVCGLPVWGDGESPCPWPPQHEPLAGCPGAGERASLRTAGGAS